MNKDVFEKIIERIIVGAIEEKWNDEVLEVSIIRYSEFNENVVDFCVDCMLCNDWIGMKRKYSVYGIISDKVIVASRTWRYDID